MDTLAEAKALLSAPSVQQAITTLLVERVKNINMQDPKAADQFVGEMRTFGELLSIPQDIAINTNE
jgi:hypothetical protein